MTALVIGSSGQLASHLREIMPAAHFLSRTDLDLRTTERIEPAVTAIAPSVLIVAAAYTAVDRAESEPFQAWLVNAAAPAALARAAARLDVPIVYVSTDYVFDGQGTKAYTETDSTNPTNAYGKSKLAGELAIAMLNPKHWILRTSWVFSEYGANFVKTMLRLGAERDRLRVVADQRGVPTYAGDLARVIAALIAADGAVPYGVHHTVGGPPVTWHGFAEAIFAAATRQGILQKAPAVDAISTADYPTPARRPANSVLTPSAALHGAIGVEPHWPAGLAHALAKLGAGR